MILSEFFREKKGIKAVFYGRHSTDKQTIETQRHVCYEYAKKNGVSIVKEYVDENVSAFKKMLDKREYLNQLRLDAKKGEFDCVLVYKADRLARKIDQHMQLWGEFRELGIPVILTEANKLYTTDSPTDIMIEIGMSSMEAENTRVRTRDHYISNTAKGKWLGGNLPYGYEYIDIEGEKNIKQIPTEIENVKLIFKLYERGYGFKRIANILNKNHPRHRGNNKWVAETVKSVITNPFYAGITTSQRIVPGAGNSIRPRNEWIQGKCDKIPSVIDYEKWETCMEIYEKKKDGKVYHNKLITPYWFIDLLYCKNCDEKVISKNHESGNKRKNGKPYGYKFYVCPLCKEKWNIDDVNEPLAEEVLSAMHYYRFTNNNFHDQIIERIKHDIAEGGEILDKYKKEKNLHSDSLNEAKNKLLLLKRMNPIPDAIQYALVQYRISVQKKIDLIEDEINRKEKEIKQLSVSAALKEKDTISFDFNLEEPEFRRLLLFFLDKVTIKTLDSGDKNYEYDIIGKIDMEQRGHIYLGIDNLEE